MIGWVHSELLAWGRWAARCDDGLGYPSQSPFARLAPSGSGWINGPTHRVPEDYARMHRCVMLLHPEALKVTVAHLYKHGYNLRRTAGFLHCDHKTVSYRRDRAHEIIAACLKRESEKQAVCELA